MEPLELSAARHATAKVASVTGRQGLVSPFNSLLKSQANSKMSHKQVSVPKGTVEALARSVLHGFRRSFETGSLHFQVQMWDLERSSAQTGTLPLLQSGSLLADKQLRTRI